MNIVKMTDVEPARIPDNVLEHAKGCFETVVVLGWDHEGKLDARASLNLSVAQINFLVDMFKAELISGGYVE